MPVPGTLETTEYHLPRRVIRKLLRGRWGRRARNVLVLAHGCAGLVHSLNRKGIRAFGIDDGQQDGDSEADEVYRGSVAGGFPYSPHTFDLVLVGACSAFRQGLRGPEPLIAMANLLSSVRSRRRLVWLQPLSGAGATVAGEQAENPVQQLSQFPGEVSMHEYQDGWERYLSLEWLIGRHREFHARLVTLTVPAKPICRLDWHQHARNAALRQSQLIRQERAA